MCTMNKNLDDNGDDSDGQELGDSEIGYFVEYDLGAESDDLIDEEIIGDDVEDEAEIFEGHPVGGSRAAAVETTLMLTAETGDAGERLDRWLTAHLVDRSRAEVQRWIQDGRVVRGAKTLKASYRLDAGDEITLHIPASTAYSVEPEDIPLDVIYEDDDLLVINKPAGMVVHPAAGNWHGTLVNAVLFHVPNLEGVGGTGRPGIVHRLDKDTSGLILVAKHDRAHRALQAQFKARTVHKTYLALAHGQVTPRTGEIQAPIGRDPRQRKRMAVVMAHQGRPAVTRYEVLSYHTLQAGHGRPSASFTLLACHPLTGRTHQIRVHLASIKHPLVGDDVYGGGRETGLACPRQFLHAQRIRFVLPSTGQEVEFTAPLPADLQSVLDRLAAQE
jgi:23S rRNA pseudouridine1911/1915/1917 synthase